MCYITQVAVSRKRRFAAAARCAVLVAVLMALLANTAAAIRIPGRWETYFTARDGAMFFGGFDIGASPGSGAVDGWDGDQPVVPAGGRMGVAQYNQHGSAWTGQTGFYTRNFESPISPGESKIWSDIYLWALDYTPIVPNRAQLLLVTEPDIAPVGYAGHLVLDYVPESTSWTGPMEYWLDLGVTNTITLPIITTADPLQGTRMHLTVYAPVPEPSSLFALTLGLLPLGATLARRRRRYK